MDASPELQLAETVVRWHNRHPLALQIIPAQVGAPGIVGVPFQAQGGRLRLASRERVLAGVSPALLARLARREGAAERPGPDDWPQRDLVPAPTEPGAPLQWRYLRTASIELAGARSRVFAAAAGGSGVLGGRLWNPRRVTGVAALAMLMVMGVAWRVVQPLPADEALALTGASATRPAPAAGTALARLDGPGRASAGSLAAGADEAATHSSGPAGAAASWPAPGADDASASAAATSAELLDGPAAPAAGRTSATAPGGATAAVPPSASASGAEAAASAATSDIRPVLSADVRTAARAEGQRLRAASAASAASPAASAVAPGTVYAVAAAPTRSRSASQLRVVLLQAPTSGAAGQPRAEVIPVAGGFRAVIWPYDDRAAAERIRDILAKRGVQAEVIAF